jgi:hypothetical protein
MINKKIMEQMKTIIQLPIWRISIGINQDSECSSDEFKIDMDDKARKVEFII